MKTLSLAYTRSQFKVFVFTAGGYSTFLSGRTSTYRYVDIYCVILKKNRSSSYSPTGLEALACMDFSRSSNFWYINPSVYDDVYRSCEWVVNYHYLAKLTPILRKDIHIYEMSLYENNANANIIDVMNKIMNDFDMPLCSVALAVNSSCLHIQGEPSTNVRENVWSNASPQRKNKIIDRKNMYRRRLEKLTPRRLLNLCMDVLAIAY